MKLPLSAVRAKQAPNSTILFPHPDTKSPQYKKINKITSCKTAQSNYQKIKHTHKNSPNITSKIDDITLKQTFRVKQSEITKRNSGRKDSFSDKIDEFRISTSKPKDKNVVPKKQDLIVKGISKGEHPQTMRDYIRIQLSKQKGSLRKSLLSQKNSKKFEALISKQDLLAQQEPFEDSALLPKNSSKKFLAIPNPQLIQNKSDMLKPAHKNRAISERKSRISQTFKSQQKMKSTENESKSDMQKSPSWLTVSNQNTSKRTNYKMNLINLIDSQSIQKNQTPVCKKFASNSLQKFYDFCLRSLQKQKNDSSKFFEHISKLPLSTNPKNEDNTNKIIFLNHEHQPTKRFHCYNQLNPEKDSQTSQKQQIKSYSPCPNMTIKSLAVQENQNNKPIFANARYTRQKQIKKIQRSITSKIKVNHYQDFALDGWAVQNEQVF